MEAAVIAEAVAIGLLGLLVVGLLRSHAEILRALHGLGVDLDPGEGAGRTRPLPAPRSIAGTERAHDIAGVALDGSAVALAIAGVEHQTVLAFLSSGCSTCHPFWDALRAGVGDDLRPGTRVIAVVEDEDTRTRLRELAGPDLDVVASTAAWIDYEVPGSPHIVLVDGPTGRIIGQGTGAAWEQVMSLVRQADDGRSVILRGDRDNAERVDAELAAAGIGTGHPSLHAGEERSGA